MAKSCGTSSAKEPMLRDMLDEVIGHYKALSALLDEQGQAIKEDDLARLCKIVLRKEKLIKEIARFDSFIRSAGGLKDARNAQPLALDKEERRIIGETVSLVSSLIKAEKESIDALKLKLAETRNDLKKMEGEQRSARSYAHQMRTQPMFLDLRR